MTITNRALGTPHHGARRHGIALAAALVCAACSSTVIGAGDPEGEQEGGTGTGEPSFTFGDTDEPVSASASEMMAKSSSNPDPTTLSGLYERTDYASEDRPSDYLVITNDVRIRVEIRQAAIAAAIQCDVVIGGRVDETRTLSAYGSSSIEVHPWGIRILEAVAMKDSWPAYDVSCGLELPDEDWPYCVATGIPDGYSSCVYMDNGRLRAKSIDGGRREVGKKIRN